jgi:HlyD family secretion protein
MAHQVAPSASPRVEPRPPAPRKGSGMLIGLTLLVVVIGAGAGYWYLQQQNKPAAGSASQLAEGGTSAEGDTPANADIKVYYAEPQAGGLERQTTQPGSVYAYQAADLYSEVPGYLEKLNVLIGDKVKEGDVLAEISAPDLAKAFEMAEANLKHVKAAAKQAAARVKTAKAAQVSAKTAIAKAVADLQNYQATLKYRTSEKERITRLVQSRSVEQKLLDEQLDRFEAAEAAVNAGKVAIDTAKANELEAEAKVEQAQADLEEAQANIDVAEAEKDKAEVYVNFTKITSPYTGVITHRNFFKGDFIPAATSGPNHQPLLSVARTDKLRIVVNVPDNDVPWTNVGDPVDILIDALPGKEFKGKVSRFAESENPADRTMHTEIDLENTAGNLREGMYGKVTIHLEPARKDALRVPSSALLDVKEGRAVIYVVQDGKIHQREVLVGTDNGDEVEILNEDKAGAGQGVKLGEKVVVKYNGALADNAVVQAEPAPVKEGREIASAH